MGLREFTFADGEVLLETSEGRLQFGVWDDLDGHYVQLSKEETIQVVTALVDLLAEGEVA